LFYWRNLKKTIKQLLMMKCHERLFLGIKQLEISIDMVYTINIYIETGGVGMCAMKISGGYVASRLTLSTKQKMVGTVSGDKQFKDWEIKYKNLDFFVKGKSDIPKGIGSIAIAQEKLDEMKRSPQKRAEFEELLENCDKAAKEMKARGGAKLVSQGFVFDKAGELTGWSLATTNGETIKYAFVLNKEEPGTWFNAMTQYTKVYEISSWQKKFDK
jgi:hypothetical protein